MVLDFVGHWLASGLLTTFLLGVAGYFGRSQLAHWLNKDIERVKAEYQAKLEADKAVLQRELEAYKISLIAEAERTRAAQDVKKARALRIADKQFSALDRLHRAMVIFSPLAVSFLYAESLVERNRLAGSITAAMKEAHESSQEAGIFLEKGERAALFDLQETFAAVVAEALEAADGVLQARAAELSETLSNLQARVLVLIGEKLHAMLDMT